MLYTIKNFGEAIRLKTLDKSLLYTKTIDHAFCFFYCLNELRYVLNKLEVHSLDKIDEYLDNLRNVSISRSIHYYAKVDYSFCFFYVLDEIKEFLAIQNMTDDRLFTLRNYL